MAGNIKTYTNDVRAPTADSAGSEAFEIEGRHIESSYAEAGQAIGQGIGRVGVAAENHYEIQDTSQVSADGAKALADGAQALQAKASDISSRLAKGESVDIDKEFNDWDTSLSTDVDKNVGSGVVTRAGEEMAERSRATVLGELQNKSQAFRSMLSGQAVTSNLDQTVSNLSTAVANDPTLLKGALGYLQGSMADQLKTHSSLSPADLGRVQSEFTEKAQQKLGITAFQAAAEANPAAAKADLQDPKGSYAGLFDPGTMDQMGKYADLQSKAKDEAAKAQATQQKEQDTQAFRSTTAALTTAMIQPDGTLRVPPGAPQALIKAGQMPGASAGEIRAQADFIRTVNKDNAAGTKAVTDPATYSMFNQKLLSGQLSDSDIYQARADGHLSDHDTSYFIGAQKNLAADPVKKAATKDFANFATGQKSAFTHGSGQISVDPTTGNITMGSSDPVGAQNYANFYRDAQAQYSATYDKDPQAAAAMLDPKSPTYLGRLAPQYLANKKSADFATTPAGNLPAKLTDKQVDGFVSDPKNKGKWFTVPSMPGKKMQVP